MYGSEKKAITDLYSKQDILFTINKADLKNFEAKVIYENPIVAPIKT